MPIPHDYTERVYAGVLGKIIGVYLGRPFEGWTYDTIMARLGEVNYFIHEQLHRSANTQLQAFGTDGLLSEHKAFVAILHYIVRHMVGQFIGLRAFYWRIFKAAHAVELCRF